MINFYRVTHKTPNSAYDYNLIEKSENFISILPGNFENVTVGLSPVSYGIDMSCTD